MRWTALRIATFLIPLTVALPTERRQQPFNYTQAVLYHHNVHRSNHSAFDLSYSDDLASTALKVAQTCVWAHNMDIDGGDYGQNLAAGLTDTQIGISISDLWYNGEVTNFANLYNLAQPSFTDFERWGHFTQLVWKNTTSVGCASWFCEGGLSGVGTDVVPWFTVCNYKGPGNFADEYATNVGVPLGQPTVDGSAPVTAP